MEKQVVVYNGTEGLQEWKRLAPHISLLCPASRMNSASRAASRSIAKSFAAEVLDGNLVEWTKELVDDSHAAGAKVYVDNLGPNDNPAGFRKAIEMGVDGIQTDYPDQLLKTLTEIAAEKPAAK